MIWLDGAYGVPHVDIELIVLDLETGPQDLRFAGSPLAPPSRRHMPPVDDELRAGIKGVSLRGA